MGIRMTTKPPIVDRTGLLAFDLMDPLSEVCDDCHTVIRNWKWMQWSFVTYDGRVVCNQCRTERLKASFLKMLLTCDAA